MNTLSRDRGCKRRVQHLAGLKPATSLSKGILSTTELQPPHLNLKRLDQKNYLNGCLLGKLMRQMVWVQNLP